MQAGQEVKELGLSLSLLSCPPSAPGSVVIAPRIPEKSLPPEKICKNKLGDLVLYRTTCLIPDDVQGVQKELITVIIKRAPRGLTDRSPMLRSAYI